MKRQALLLGFYATGGQALLLRELISSLNGTELFIGTALFSWLIWVALGALLGGRFRLGLPPALYFAVGALILPASVLVARLAPLAVTQFSGELIPTGEAMVISVAVVMPVGIVSGWLFPVIAARHDDQARAITRVYLWEGVGAFAAGTLITLVTGEILGTLSASLVTSAVVLGALLVCGERSGYPRVGVAAGFVALTCWAVADVGPVLDRYLDGIRYASFHVHESFDTPLGHQAVLERNGTVTLLTDNGVEAVHPDPAVAEDLLIPPLAFRPDAHRLLILGRTEFGIAQLASEFDDLRVTAVDARGALDTILSATIANTEGVERIAEDPLRFIEGQSGPAQFDVVTLTPREPASYQACRLLTPSFMRSVKRRLTPGGVLFLPTHYDSDRYITPAESLLLGVFYGVLDESFAYVTMWPGTRTLFFASDQPVLDVPLDSITARLARLDYEPQFLSEAYLNDRLNPLKRRRLEAALGEQRGLHQTARPTLPHYHAGYRAQTAALDRAIVGALTDHPLRLVGGLAGLLLIMFVMGLRRGASRSFALALYFVAGAVSLTLELVSFYTYQAAAGTLYSELAVLIGVFMLGLAAGTYVGQIKSLRGVEYGALSLLVLATGLFWLTYDAVPAPTLLLYHLLFLFVVAFGTGGLFAAATARYYRESPRGNRGLGYACELCGASLGALLPLTIMLPVMGLSILLGSLLAILCIVFLAGIWVDYRG